VFIRLVNVRCMLRLASAASERQVIAADLHAQLLILLQVLLPIRSWCNYALLTALATMNGPVFKLNYTQLALVLFAKLLAAVVHRKRRCSSMRSEAFCAFK